MLSALVVVVTPVKTHDASPSSLAGGGLSVLDRSPKMDAMSASLYLDTSFALVKRL
jgi:hypothetical protein